MRLTLHQTCAKHVTVLDAILWMRWGWNTVTANTITKCFAKCGFTTDQPSTDDADDDLWDADDLLPQLPAEVTLQDYVAADDHLDTQNNYSDSWERELMDYNRASNDTPDSAEEDSADVELPSNPKISLCQLHGPTPPIFASLPCKPTIPASWSLYHQHKTYYRRRR